MENKKTSISDDNIYPSFCDLAAKNELVFNTFRSNQNYTGILEHVTVSQGSEYLEIIKRDNPNLLNDVDKFKTSDLVGSPSTFNYEIGKLSPTTIRYIKVLSDLIREFGDLSNLNIAEIGCGYAGQAKIIMDVFNVKSYTLIDLPEVLNLSKKYLESTGVNMDKISFKTMDMLESSNYDLFISNYAYTECTREVQLEYFNKVISNSKSGYITANFINNIFNLDYFTKNELCNMIENSYLIEEEPKTHENNIIISWR